MMVTVLLSSGLLNAYTSVLSANGSSEINGASLWEDANTWKDNKMNVKLKHSFHPLQSTNFFLINEILKMNNSGTGYFNVRYTHWFIVWI